MKQTAMSTLKIIPPETWFRLKIRSLVVIMRKKADSPNFANVGQTRILKSYKTISNEQQDSRIVQVFINDQSFQIATQSLLRFSYVSLDVSIMLLRLCVQNVG